MRATRSAKLLAVCAAALFLAFGCGGTDDNETAANPDTAAAAGPMTCAEHEQLTDDITERSARLGLEAGAGDKTEDEWMPELIGLMAENAANTEAAHRDGCATAETVDAARQALALICDETGSTAAGCATAGTP